MGTTRWSCCNEFMLKRFEAVSFYSRLQLGFAVTRFVVRSRLQWQTIRTIVCC
jgi:hypothetical protein